MPTPVAMRLIAIAFALVLAGCTASQGDGARDNANDPAVADAMAGPVMSDLQMSGAVSPDALRPGEQPATLPVPLDARIDTAGAPTLDQVAAMAVRDPGFAGCTSVIAYSAMWSVKLPPALALPKAARLAEAAGSDRAGCALRIVRFAMSGPPAAVRGGYEALAKREGFVVTAIDGGLSAARARDGVAFRVTAVLSKDGSRVDLATRTR